MIYERGITVETFPCWLKPEPRTKFAVAFGDYGGWTTKEESARDWFERCIQRQKHHQEGGDAQG